MTIRDPKHGERPKDEKTRLEKAREDWFNLVPESSQQRHTSMGQPNNTDRRIKWAPLEKILKALGIKE